MLYSPAGSSQDNWLWKLPFCEIFWLWKSPTIISTLAHFSLTRLPPLVILLEVHVTGITLFWLENNMLKNMNRLWIVYLMYFGFRFSKPPSSLCGLYAIPISPAISSNAKTRLFWSWAHLHMQTSMGRKWKSGSQISCIQFAWTKGGFWTNKQLCVCVFKGFERIFASLKERAEIKHHSPSPSALDKSPILVLIRKNENHSNPICIFSHFIYPLQLWLKSSDRTNMSKWVLINLPQSKDSVST